MLTEIISSFEIILCQQARARLENNTILKYEKADEEVRAKEQICFKELEILMKIMRFLKYTS